MAGGVNQFVKERGVVALRLLEPFPHRQTDIILADDIAREDIAVAIDFRADAPGFAIAAQAAAANFQRAQTFLQALLERAADGHRFAHAFHLRGERGVGLREFLEGEARNFRDDVINARFEAGRNNNSNNLKFLTTACHF